MKILKQKLNIIQLCSWKRIKILKQVRYNCSAHCSAHLFIIAIRSHSHIKWNLKKYMLRKIYELNTLIGYSDDSYPQAQNKYIVKIRRLQNNYWWRCFYYFVKFCTYKASVFSETNLIPPYFFPQWMVLSFFFEIDAHLGHLFCKNP